MKCSDDFVGDVVRSIGKLLSIITGAIMIIGLFGCGMQKLDGDGMVYKPAYVSISQDEAKLMMKDDDGHVIVDVRRTDEYVFMSSLGFSLLTKFIYAALIIGGLEQYSFLAGCGESWGHALMCLAFWKAYRNNRG